MKNDPPKVGIWLLLLLYRSSGSQEALMGDLIERFREGQTRSWFYRQVFKAIIILCSRGLNTGIQRLRERRPLESLDESDHDEEGFRPRQVQAWTEDPEQLYSQAEMRSLVENGVMKLPVKYRMVLMLRDIEQLPIEEAASTLGLGIPATKARLSRGRLMLREALAPHFIPPGDRGSAKGVTN